VAGDVIHNSAHRYLGESTLAGPDKWRLVIDHRRIAGPVWFAR